MTVAIYLDHAATTPMSPDVVAAYTEAMTVVGNPSSIHSHGQNARRMLEEARETVARSIGADAAELTFTASGTEAVNLAVKGLYWARAPRRRILVSRAEHHATLDAVEWLVEHEGAEVDWIPVDGFGRIDAEYIAGAIGDDVALVSLLWANNEVGTLQPMDAVVQCARAAGVPVHCDAIAAYGYVPLDFRASGLAALSISAHKVGGPTGIGALAIARTASVTPLIHGGGQQRARSGTQDVAGAVAFGVAAEAIGFAAGGPGPARVAAIRELRDRLLAGVTGSSPHVTVRGHPTDRLPGNAHVTVDGCDSDSLLFLLDSAGFSVSTGSACRAGVAEASHVLLAMALSEDDARGALRISIGSSTTSEQVDAFVAALPAAIDRARTVAATPTTAGHPVRLGSDS